MLDIPNNTILKVNERDKLYTSHTHKILYIPVPVVVNNGAVIVIKYLFVVLFLEAETFALDSRKPGGTDKIFYCGDWCSGSYPYMKALFFLCIFWTV